MKVLVWTSMLLLLTVVCSIAGLARMVGMPLGGEFIAGILVLSAAVGGLGVALLVAPEVRPVPTPVV